MPKTGKRPGAEVREQQILDAAIEVFGEKNYDWATTKEIADKAGLSERMVFFYFDSKKGLYRAALRRSAEDFVKALLKGKPPIDDIRTFIKMTARNMLNFFEEHTPTMKLILKNISVEGDPDIRKDSQEILNNIYALLNSFIVTAKERGYMPEDLRDDTATVYFIGFIMVVAYAEIFDLDWFRGDHEDILTIGDYYVDAITRR